MDVYLLTILLTPCIPLSVFFHQVSVILSIWEHTYNNNIKRRSFQQYLGALWRRQSSSVYQQ